MAFRVRKLSGTFEKRPPGSEHKRQCKQICLLDESETRIYDLQTPRNNVIRVHAMRLF